MTTPILPPPEVASVATPVIGEFRSPAGRLPQTILQGSIWLVRPDPRTPLPILPNPWVTDLNSGSLSDFDTGNASVVLARGAASIYSLELTSDEPSGNPYALKTLPVPGPNRNLRFYIAIDPNARYAADSVTSLVELGTPSQVALRIALLNPSTAREQKPVVALIHPVSATYYDILWESPTAAMAVPTYFEVDISSTITVYWDYYAPVLIASPAIPNITQLNFQSYTVEGLAQRVSAYISDIATSDGSTGQIGYGTNAPDPALTYVDPNMGTRYSLSQGRIWFYPSAAPIVVGKDVYNFANSPFEFDINTPSLSPVKSPIAVGGVVTALMTNGPDLTFYTIDSRRGEPQSSFTLKGFTVTANRSLVTADDAFLVPGRFASNPGVDYLVCFDPFLCKERWRQPFTGSSQSSETIRDIVPWNINIPLPITGTTPSGPPAYLVLSTTPTAAWLTFYTAELTFVARVTWNVYTQPGRILAVDDYGQVVVYAGVQNAPNQLMVVNMVTALQNAEIASNFTRSAPTAGESSIVTLNGNITGDYPYLPDQAVPLQSYILRDVVSISQDCSRLALCLASPSTTVNVNPQTVSVAHFAWSPTISAAATTLTPTFETSFQNNDSATPFEIGQLRTDPMNNTYLTYRNVDSNHVRRWQLVILNPDGTIFQFQTYPTGSPPQQPILLGDPGMPSPTPVGGLSRYDLLVQDLYGLILAETPIHFWPFTEAGTFAYDQVNPATAWTITGSKATTPPLIPNSDLPFLHNASTKAPSPFSLPTQPFSLEFVIRAPVGATGTAFGGYISAGGDGLAVTLNPNGTLLVRSVVSGVTYTLSSTAIVANNQPHHVELKFYKPAQPVTPANLTPIATAGSAAICTVITPGPVTLALAATCMVAATCTVVIPSQANLTLTVTGFTSAATCTVTTPGPVSLSLIAVGAKSAATCTTIVPALQIVVDGVLDQTSVFRLTSTSIVWGIGGTATAGVVSAVLTGDLAWVAFVSNPDPNLASHANIVQNGPTLKERWLSTQAWVPNTQTPSRLDVVAPIDDSLLTKSAAPVAPFDRIPLPMVPSSLNPGGVVEVWEKQPSGDFIRLAFANDVIAGLTRTRDLTQLEKITFEIALDSFKPESGSRNGSFLRDLQAKWQADHQEFPGSQTGPYDKAQKVRDHVYLSYTEIGGRRLMWRVMTIDDSSETTFSGTGGSIALELADKLTQYVAGRSEFAGNLPSEIGTRILNGDQSIVLPNRKFTRDRSPSLTSLTDIPSMVPSYYNANYGTGTAVNGLSGPQPYIMSIDSAVPSDAELFSGIPADTIPPQGTTRSLQSGHYGYHGFNDAALNLAGAFQVIRADGISPTYFNIVGPINLSTTGWGTDMGGSQEGYAQNSPTSRILYGGIYADVDGVYSFQINAVGANKMYFQGVPIIDQWYNSSTATYGNAKVQLRGGRWYPFVIWHATPATAATSAASLALYWQTPSVHSWVLVPADHLTHQLHGGLFIVKFSDNGQAPYGSGDYIGPSVRFMTAYKKWDGHGIVLGYALPETYYQTQYVEVNYNTGALAPQTNTTWTTGVSAGVLIEEGIFPWQTYYQPCDWGTGWTRRPGPNLRGSVPQPISRFTPARNY